MNRKVSSQELNSGPHSPVLERRVTGEHDGLGQTDCDQRYDAPYLGRLGHRSNRDVMSNAEDARPEENLE
jgi:hypothetical protein